VLPEQVAACEREHARDRRVDGEQHDQRDRYLREVGEPGRAGR